MSRKIKYSKVAIVVFLTLLIWVWTDLTLDKTLLVPNVSISIVKSSSPTLWATFRSEDELPVSSISIKYIVLKGSTSRIAEVEREQSMKLDFSLNPEYQGMTTAGSHTLSVLDFLKKRSNEIRELTGLTVESCEPNMLTVNVEMLVETSLTVKCFNESRRSQDFQSITPPTVTMFVPDGWGRERPARVELTLGEIEQARSEAIEKIPFVLLADGQKRYADDPVQVKMPPEGDRLEKLKVGEVGVSFCFSPITQGKYRVLLDNETEVMSVIDIRATQQAKDEYEAMIYQVRLEIYDDDPEATDWVSRELKYDFPDEHVAKGDIKLDQDPVEARFKLIAATSDDGS